MARQRLGQHFLADEGWREQIARAIRVSPHGMAGNAVTEDREYSWIEVGAGHGEMTEHLLQSGKPVLAVELDAPLIANLQRMAKLQPNLTVVPGNVLETDLGQLAAGRRIRIYGNLPYYITSPILHHFFRFASLIDEIYIVIQLEVAERLVARPDTSKLYGYLSVATQFYSRPELLLRLPRGAFRPPPEVDSALVRMRLPGEDVAVKMANPDDFLEFVKRCFAQKRKTLANNLRELAKPEQLRGLLRELQLREDARAEQLGVRELANIYLALQNKPVESP
ncbi:MAG TPA: 16S rRNA (adenine(1518)-N(6)/adenine(1519)-N(6))-dimethyltransferase RsmA [Candidatus Acidoferrum sp.]